MQFTVLPTSTRPPAAAKSECFLITDDWDDWFEFSTMYRLYYVDAAGMAHDIGNVKFGRIRMKKAQRRPGIPARFEALDERFFSVGQDDTYYTALNELPDGIGREILLALRDMALDPEIFERALAERVTGVSLLRSVSKSTVRGQFHRMATGGARLSEYSFTYSTATDAVSESVTLSFEVEPESQPPTNIHVLIGRNGVGKTHLLNRMTRAIVDRRAEADDVGRFSFGNEAEIGDHAFANLVSVTFSAFDPFEPLPTRRDKSSGVQYAYIGLRRTGDAAVQPGAPKSPSQLAREFSESVKVCRTGARLARWRHALEMLETDPIFRDANVASLADHYDDADEMKKAALALFKKLSSGHKIVLLTTTRLVETVEERTLVLLDEPEAHLHPPLLSAFVRALSDLLINRNGVAIVATHSPVVLQEVPRCCAWKIRRTGREVVAERPEIETFGENVAVLTREVFGLEVTQSGFHRLLRASITPNSSFERVLASFENQLGDEARAIVRGLIATRNADDEL